jgi:hypothetical protein
VRPGARLRAPFRGLAGTIYFFRAFRADILRDFRAPPRRVFRADRADFRVRFPPVLRAAFRVFLAFVAFLAFLAFLARLAGFRALVLRAFRGFLALALEAGFGAPAGADGRDGAGCAAGVGVNAGRGGGVAAGMPGMSGYGGYRVSSSIVSTSRRCGGASLAPCPAMVRWAKFAPGTPGRQAWGCGYRIVWRESVGS